MLLIGNGETCEHSGCQFCGVVTDDRGGAECAVTRIDCRADTCDCRRVFVAGHGVDFNRRYVSRRELIKFGLWNLQIGNQLVGIRNAKSFLALDDALSKLDLSVGHIARDRRANPRVVVS